MDEGEYVFATAVEGLYLRGLDGRLKPSLKAQLKDAGLDLDHILPAYPLETWEGALRLTCAALFSDRTFDQGMAELGRLTIDGYQHTAIGKALFPLMRLLGPARVLARMSRNFQSANNYTQTKVEQLSPTQAELWINRVIQPAYYQGMIEAALRAAGAQTLAVELGMRDGRSHTFRIQWDA